MTEREQSITTESLRLPVKRTTGETLEDRLTDNAYYNILPARYLKKNQDGEPMEDQEELFERVAKNVALAEAVYEAEKQDVEVMVTPDQLKPDHPRRDELAEEVFGMGVTVGDGVETQLTERNVSKFAYDTVTDELPEEVQEHVVEVKDEFQEMMERLSFMPNSPTLMNAGDELQQLSACFVNSPEDDIDDIHDTAREAAKIFQSGGGMGYAFWRLRPFGDTVGSTGGIASGPITFMRTYDQMCETIAQGGARRGAQMGIMRVSHPDVIQFIHAKNKDVSLAHSLRLNDPDDFTHNKFVDALDEAREFIDEDGRVPEHLRNAVEGHLSNFNISVAVTDDFMQAVKNEEEYTLTNPRTGEAHIATEETKELYSRFGLGDEVEVGEELSIPALELFQRIVDGAHENGEPGVVFIDKINEDHSFDVESTPSGDSSEYEILATNPCGEQPLMEGEACNLGHINFSTLAATDSPDWRVWSEGRDGDLETLVGEFLDEAVEWDEFDHRIEYGTRFLENVVTMSDFPVEKIRKTVRDNRKVGLGIMGIAQLYIQLGVKYGSDVGDEIARQLMTYVNQSSKETSHELAEDRGVFNNWDDSKYANPTEYREWFERQTGKNPDDWEDGYEIRNHNTTTIAPTGTTSMVGNTSGGCEPIYNVAYYKNVSDDVQGDEMLVEFDDYFLRVLEENDLDVKAVKQEAQEQMANNEFRGIDGLSSVPDVIGELFVTTSELSAKEHASIQCAFQEGVDSAISKTVNAPNHASVEDAMDAFEYVYDNGGKGVTYYRDGTRNKQVITTRAQNSQFAELEEDEAVEAILDEIEGTFGGLQEFFDREEVEEYLEDEVAVIGEDELTDSPEQFDSVRPRPDSLSGVTQRIETGYGKVYVTINEDEDGRPFELFANIGHSGGFTNSFTEAVAKVVSTALRSGVNPQEVVDELQGTRSPKVAWDRGSRIQSIPDALGTALQRHIDGEVDGTYPQQQQLDESIEMDEKVDLGETTDDEEASGSNETGAVEEAIARGETPECPECGSLNIYFSEGCKTCEGCGWSEC